MVYLPNTNYYFDDEELIAENYEKKELIKKSYSSFPVIKSKNNSSNFKIS